MENDLSARIRSRLEALGKSAASASVEAGLGRSAITDILSGNSGSPRLATLEKLTTVLECSLAFLIGASFEPGMNPQPTMEDGQPSLPPKWVNAALESRLGVFEDERTRRGKIHGINRYYWMSGDSEHPTWDVFGVYVADSSLSGIGIHEGCVATLIRPKDKQAIPLRHETVVFCSVQIPTIDLVETSLRLVKREKQQIHLIGDPHLSTNDDTRTPARRLVIDIAKISDNEDNNSYQTSGFNVKVRGIALRIISDLPKILND